MTTDVKSTCSLDSKGIRNAFPAPRHTHKGRRRGEEKHIFLHFVLLPTLKSYEKSFLMLCTKLEKIKTSSSGDADGVMEILLWYAMASTLLL